MSTQASNSDTSTSLISTTLCVSTFNVIFLSLMIGTFYMIVMDQNFKYHEYQTGTLIVVMILVILIAMTGAGIGYTIDGYYYEKNKEVKEKKIYYGYNFSLIALSVIIILNMTASMIASDRNGSSGHYYTGVDSTPILLVFNAFGACLKPLFEIIGK